jgi:hypothetical protein
MTNFDDLLDNPKSIGNGVPLSESDAPTEQENGGQLSKDEYAAKKRIERDKVYELADNTAMEVAVSSDRFKQYLDVQAHFDRYSAVNTLLILAQKPEAMRLGDFDYWKNQGGFIKQGQSGISILEPGKEYEREDGSIGVFYNTKKVFDISQVDTRKIKVTPAPKFTERQLLQALILKSTAKITGVDELPEYLPDDKRGENGSARDPQTGEIFIRKGMEFSDTFSAIMLELAYAEVLNGAKEAAKLRFTAYSAAYILCKKYGVDVRNFRFDEAPATFAMIPEINPQIMKHELSIIRDAADTISGRMARQLETISKAARAQEAR